MDDWHAWYTLAVLLAAIFGLVRDKLAPELIFGGALVLLMAAGVLAPHEAVAVFANEQMLTIAALFIVAAALRDSGGLQLLTEKLFKGPIGPKRALLRLMIPTTVLSAFINNTPVVAVLAPAVREWAKRRGRAPSRYLIPISYAAIFGGTCTVIGTSTNLLVSGLLVEHGDSPFAMFADLAPIGVTIAVVGTLYMLLIGRRLLPERRDPFESLGAEGKEYLAALEVQEQCPLVGGTVEQAGLRHLSGLFLVEIVRDGQALVPVRPTENIRTGDHLVFAGLADSLASRRRSSTRAPSASRRAAA